jgi:hypothetical protein
LGGLFFILALRKTPMSEKKSNPADNLAEFQARIKEHLQKFEVIRGFL